MVRWVSLGLLLIWIAVLAALTPRPVHRPPAPVAPEWSFHPDVNEPEGWPFATRGFVELLEEIESLSPEEQAARVADFSDFLAGSFDAEALDYLLGLGTASVPALLEIIEHDLWFDEKSSLVKRVLGRFESLGAGAVRILARIHDEEPFWS